MHEFGNRDFWLELNPVGHIEDREYFSRIELMELETRQLSAAMERMSEEGYFQLRNLEWADLIQRCRAMVQNLEARGVPCVFAFVYDEFWELFYKLHPLLKHLFGGRYHIMPEFWVWALDPKRQDSGWNVHRDRGPESLFEDGSPKCVTVWLPLTESTPDNGCIYVVPSNRDKNYGDKDEKAYDGFELSSIRALPAAPGELLCWNQAILHWGAQASRFAEAPRLSVAMEFQAAKAPPMCKPLLRPSSVLGFNDRLRLCVAQIMAYQHIYHFNDELLAVLQSVVAKLKAKAPK